MIYLSRNNSRFLQTWVLLDWFKKYLTVPALLFWQFCTAGAKCVIYSKSANVTAVLRIVIPLPSNQKFCKRHFSQNPDVKLYFRREDLRRKSYRDKISEILWLNRQCTQVRWSLVDKLHNYDGIRDSKLAIMASNAATKEEIRPCQKSGKYWLAQHGQRLCSTVAVLIDKLMALGWPEEAPKCSPSRAGMEIFGRGINIDFSPSLPGTRKDSHGVVCSLVHLLHTFVFREEGLRTWKTFVNCPLIDLRHPSFRFINSLVLSRRGPLKAAAATAAQDYEGRHQQKGLWRPTTGEG